MAIYDISGEKNREEEEFSTLSWGKRMGVFGVTRLLFACLLVADLLWLICHVVTFLPLAFLQGMSWGYFAPLTRAYSAVWAGVKRTLVCALALVFSFFSPSFGLMVACMYFLMYDREGVEKIIPSFLRGEFEEVFSNFEE